MKGCLGEATTDPRAFLAVAGLSSVAVPQVSACGPNLQQQDPAVCGWKRWGGSRRGSGGVVGVLWRRGGGGGVVGSGKVVGPGVGTTHGTSLDLPLTPPVWSLECQAIDKRDNTPPKCQRPKRTKSGNSQRRAQRPLMMKKSTIKSSLLVFRRRRREVCLLPTQPKLH
ncbi:hypothetical protein FN846DRAFT_957481 [Sphaerosporella brunnea]|uniref:Uncharacterized protein n=1 Tax=Sphaerosporella brunnea TaxID=1250544 RepID=A0A5J5ESI4_9PEZI|nr:hypothetical protein FN846DRAFT_957481 [Sphaerosporella brunnea]